MLAAELFRNPGRLESDQGSGWGNRLLVRGVSKAELRTGL